MRSAFWLALCGALLLGLSPILVRLSEVGPTSTAFYRVFITLPFFALLFMGTKQTGNGKDARANGFILLREIAARKYKDLGSFVLLGLFLCANLICWHLSLQYTFIANAALLACLSTLFVIPLGWLLWGLRVHAHFVLYALCSFIGVVMLMSANLGEGSYIKGDLLALSAAGFYAVYQLLIGQLRKRYGTAEQMFWTMLFAALAILPCVWIFGESLLILSWMGLLIVLALSLLCQFTAQGFLSYSLGYITPSLVSLTLLVEPIVAAGLGWLFFAEVLNFLQFSGMAITLFFLYMAKRASGE